MSRPEGAVWRAPHFCERVGLRKIENLALSGNPYDRARRILQSQVMPILHPGEQVLHTASVRQQPGSLRQALLLGPLLGFLMTKAYFAVLTSRRLLLIRTKAGFWSSTGAPHLTNPTLGVEEHEARQIQRVTTGELGHLRSMTFHMASGTKMTLRLSPWFKRVSGTQAFFEQVPSIIASGQLAARSKT